MQTVYTLKQETNINKTPATHLIVDAKGKAMWAFAFSQIHLPVPGNSDEWNSHQRVEGDWTGLVDLSSKVEE